MFYPNILRLLAHQHAVPLERAHRLWDQAAEHSAVPMGVTPDDTPDWESVMSRFLQSIRCEARALRSAFCSVKVLVDLLTVGRAHDHFATPFLDYRTRTIRSVDSFEAAKQEYAVSGADEHGLVEIGKDMRSDMVCGIAETCEETLFSRQREVRRTEVAFIEWAVADLPIRQPPATTAHELNADAHDLAGYGVRIYTVC